MNILFWRALFFIDRRQQAGKVVVINIVSRANCSWGTSLLHRYTSITWTQFTTTIKRYESAQTNINIIKLGASSSWSSSLHCPKRNSVQMTTGKKHPTLLYASKIVFRVTKEITILAKLEESKSSNDDRVEDIETGEDSLTDNLKLLNKENISNVLGKHSKIDVIHEKFWHKVGNSTWITFLWFWIFKRSVLHSMFNSIRRPVPADWTSKSKWNLQAANTTHWT